MRELPKSRFAALVYTSNSDSCCMLKPNRELENRVPLLLIPYHILRLIVHIHSCEIAGLIS
jgi:hypothetical protein